MLSWPRAGQPPLKIKVKHPSFLDLQKVVHAATPKAILDALRNGNVNLLNTWIGQTNDQLGQWVQSLGRQVQRQVRQHSPEVQDGNERGHHQERDPQGLCSLHSGRGSKFEYVHPSVCFAMLDDKDHRPIIWKFVEQAFEAELSQAFAVLEE